MILVLSKIYFSLMKLIVGLYLCVILLTQNYAYACVTGTMSDSKALEIYDVVFAGKLVGCATEGNESFTKYSVDRIWKGEVKQVYTSLVPVCRMDWLDELVGKDILIFANKVEGSSHIDRPDGLCSPGRLLAPIRIKRYFFGFPLSRIFDIQSLHPLDDLKELGTPIHAF